MSEKVECPFCDTEVTLEYQGGMSFGSGGVVGAMPTQEGTCTKCKASVCGEPILTKAGFFDILVYANKPVPKDMKDNVVIFHLDDVKSYTIREGVRIP